MPKYQCEECGALWAGWAGSRICRKCGGRIRKIPWIKYYEEKKKQESNPVSRIS